MNNIKNESLDMLKEALKETGVLLDHLFNLEDDYPFLREHLDDAAECVEESLEMKDDDLGEVREALQNESQRVEEFRFYIHALQHFCMDSHIGLPRFITNGFDRLCEKEYRRAGSLSASSSPDMEDDWLFQKGPQESLEEAMPW